MAESKTPLIFGEVLFDCFPDGRRVLGGAPFNVAWHCQAFGLQPVFISRVGKDDPGKEIVSNMQDWGMDISGLQHDDKYPTGEVRVSFRNGEPSYDIIENSAWDFIGRDELPDLMGNFLLYHGTLVSRNNESKTSLDTLKKKADCPVFVDINLRSPWWELSAVKEAIKDSNWLKLNENELIQIMPGDEGLEDKMSSLLSGNVLDLLIVTRGDQGAIVMTPESDIFSMKPVQNTLVTDTVGAGDAFSSIIMVGHYYGWSLQTTMERAQAFASAIVGIQGAINRDKSFYQPFIKAWQLG